MGKLDDIRNLCRKHRPVLLYLFFGVCTTAVNVACYRLLYKTLGVSNLYSSVLAWAASVLFAYGTNRRYVFQSAANGLREVFLGRLFLRMSAGDGRAGRPYHGGGG